MIETEPRAAPQMEPSELAADERGARGLAFDEPGGPVVAVCGLCGGAGASTLAYTLAAAAAKGSRAPVLACETSGVTGGLAVYARAHGSLSLGEAANQVAAGQTPDALVASSPDGVRVLGSRPSIGECADPDGVAQILSEAQASAGLLVLDCGTCSHEPDRLALGAATQVLWLMPATVSGLARAERALELLAPDVDAVQALVVRLDRGERAAVVSQLAELAARWKMGLILFPHVPDMAETLVEEAIEDAQVALEAIGAMLR